MGSEIIEALVDIIETLKPYNISAKDKKRIAEDLLRISEIVKGIFLTHYGKEK